MKAMPKRMTPDSAARFFAILAQARPDPTTELTYINPYTLLVAVVLSAQSTDVSVNKATEPLFKLADDPAKMVALGEARLREFIKTIGLYRTKAKNVIGLSQLLLEKHGGHVPDSREALEELPGVGRKTANVVLNVAFGHETIAVDTHIFRVANRTGLAPGKDPLEVEQELEKIVPAQFKRHAHHWLILHGRYVCTARNPKCMECPVSALCLYPEKTMAEGARTPARPPSNKPRASALSPTRPRAARRARKRAATSRGG